MPTWKSKGGGYHNTEEVGLSQDTSALLINGYVDDFDNTIKIPGKVPFAWISDNLGVDVTQPITGLFFWRNNNILIAVSNPLGATSAEIYWIDMGNTSSKGQVTGVGITLSSLYPPVFVDGLWSGVPKIWIASGGRMINLTVTRTSGVITSVVKSYVADANAPVTVSHLGFLDGYILCNYVGTSEIHMTVDSTNPDLWTAVAAPTVHYFVCDYRPDNIIAFTIFNREIVCFGGASIETWYLDSSSISSIPFSRLNAACFDVGIASQAGYCIVDGLLYWVDGQQQIRGFDGRNISIVSRSMQKYLSDLNTKDVKLCLGLVEGRSVLFIIFPSAGIVNGVNYGVTLCYDVIKKDWAFWGETLTDAAAYEATPQNPLYGGTTNFNGFKMYRDKINCSVQVLPILSGDSGNSQKQAVGFSSTGAGDVSWYNYPSDTLTQFLSTGSFVLTEQSILVCVNHKIYLLGGHSHVAVGGDEYRNFVLPYNIATQIWEIQTIANMPKTLAYSSYVVHNTTIYIVGGRSLEVSGLYVHQSVVWSLEVTTGVWTQYTPTIQMFSACGNLTYIPNIDYLLYIGPDTRTGSAITRVYVAAVSDLNTWYTLTQVMPTPRFMFGMAVIGTKLYTIGGSTDFGNLGYSIFSSSIIAKAVADIEILDLVTGVWTTPITTGFSARAGFGCSVVAGLIYCIGGWDSAGNVTSTIQIYNPVTNVWTTSVTPLTYPVAGFAGGLLPENTIRYINQNPVTESGIFTVFGAQIQANPGNLPTRIQRYLP